MKKIEYLPTPATGFSQERINDETQDKINEIVEKLNEIISFLVED